MGNIKKIRRKYQGPSHPWDKERIVKEKEYINEYGLKNKKEIWRMASLLKKYKTLAKKYITIHTNQSEKESKQLLDRLRVIGLLNETSMLNDVLTLSDKDILERRLQTLVFRRGLARSVDQARQFIVHGHIKVNGRMITSPSYIVRKAEEDSIQFCDNSALNNKEHPERVVIKKEETEKKDKKEEKRRERRKGRKKIENDKKTR